MAMALSPTARLVMGDAPPQSESDEDDFEALTMTGAVASTLDPSVRFAKYAEIEEVVGVGHLLCEECERDEAVCRCEACAETLCSRCFVLTHPPRGPVPTATARPPKANHRLSAAREKQGTRVGLPVLPLLNTFCAAFSKE